MANKKSHQDSIFEFMSACGQIGSKEVNPAKLTPEDVATARLRLKLTIEETSELFEAFMTKQAYQDYFGKYFNSIQESIDMLGIDNIELDKVEIADAITDLDYVNGGIGVWLNLPLEECFDAVHTNNMTKVDPVTKKVTKNESGKILKPQGFKPVDLAVILEDYSFNGN